MLVIFHRVLPDSDSDVLYSERCQTKELSVVCCEKFAFFKAIFKANQSGKRLGPIQRGLWGPTQSGLWGKRLGPIQHSDKESQTSSPKAPFTVTADKSLLTTKSENILFGFQDTGQHEVKSLR